MGLPNKVYAMVRTVRLWKAHLCVWCGRPAVTRLHCEEHRIRHNQLVKQYRLRKKLPD